MTCWWQALAGAVREWTEYQAHKRRSASWQATCTALWKVCNGIRERTGRIPYRILREGGFPEPAFEYDEPPEPIDLANWQGLATATITIHLVKLGEVRGSKPGQLFYQLEEDGELITL